MASLVYAPEVRIRIQTAPGSRGKGKIVDVTEDISRGSVTRILNGISSSEFTLLNQSRKYDEMFTPMDPVVIYLRRIKTLMKFSGYLEYTPLWNSLPGSISMRAVCSLTRLDNYAWDPGAQASVALMAPNATNAPLLEDGGLSQLAIRVMTKVAKWPLGSIHISRIPSTWYNTVSSLADKLIAEANALSMSHAVGSGSWIGGNNGSSKGTSTIPGIGPGTGTMPATQGKCSSFGGPAGGAYGSFALTGESGILPNDGWYCLPGSALVYTQRGPVAIEDVQVGEQVWSVEDDKPRLAAVTNKVETGIKSLVEIKTRGRTLKCTPQHRVLILNRAGTRKTRREVQTEWVEAGSLTKGDVVVALSGVEPQGLVEPTPEQARVAGWMVADGSRGDYRSNTDGTYGSGPTRWALCLNEHERPGKVEILRSLGYAVDDNPDRCCVGFMTIDLHPWLADVMTHKSPDRYIPEWVWTASTSVQEAFIEGIMDGDGNLGQVSTTQGTLMFRQTSERLIRELRVLAHLLGWGTGNVEGPLRSTSSYPNAKPLWRFVAYRSYPWASVPTSYSRNGLALAKGLVGQTVISVTAAGEEPCWDLEVHGPGSFVAEGVVVHNCAMRWPYVNPDLTPASGVNVSQAKAWWANRHILVTNPKTNKTIVVRAADWGPNLNTGRVIDLAPNALKALGAVTDDVLTMGFAPAGSQLGVASASINTGTTTSSVFGQLTTSTSGGASGISSGWGNFGDPANMVTVQAQGCTFTVNKIAQRNFVGFVNDLANQLGYHPQNIGGFRASGGGGGPQNHGYGAAIDIDPGSNPWSPNNVPMHYSLPGPPAIVQLARKWGLKWGGEYMHSKDYMHFEVIGAPFTGSVPTFDGISSATGGSGVVAKWTPPIKSPPGYTITMDFGVADSHSASGIHSGTDFACPSGTPIYPVGPGTIHNHGSGDPNYGNWVDVDMGGNVYTFYAHMIAPSPVPVGTAVTQDTVIGKVGQTGNATGPHVHVELRIGADTYAAALKSGGIDKYVLGGANRSNPPAGTIAPQGNTSGATGTGGTAADFTDIGQRLFDVWQYTNRAMETDGGNLLGGYRALINDTTVLSSVAQFMSAGMRDFCSAPNGDFIAWFPDFFGHLGQIGKMIISPLEILEEGGPPTVGWNAQALKTHQFVTTGFSGPGAPYSDPIIGMTTTAGIASVEFPELMMALFNITKAEATHLRDFYLNRFGARPVVTNLDQISTPQAEFFFACYLFQQNFSQQFQASVRLSFMPELYPGMMACFPDYGLQGYIIQTIDTWDLQGGGFTTDVTCAPWSSIGKPNASMGILPRGAPL